MGECISRVPDGEATDPTKEAIQVSVRFHCDKCSAKYTIADDKVRGKVVTIKCAKCGNKMSLDGRGLAAAPAPAAQVEERTQVASASDMQALRASLASQAVPMSAPTATEPTLSDGWYAILKKKQLGPLTGAEVQEYIAQGTLTARTYVWRDGQGDWKRASDVPAIAAALAPKSALPAAGSASPVRTNGTHPAGSAQKHSSSTNGCNVDSIAAVSQPGIAQASPVHEGQPATPDAPPARASEKDLNSLLFDDSETEEVIAQAQSFDLSPGRAENRGAPGAGSARAADAFNPLPGYEGPSSGKHDIGEETRFYLAEAGVNRRNPLWKIMLFIGALIGVPILLLFLISKIHVGFLEVTTSVDETTGKPVTASVFSTEGLGTLRDRLTGKKQPSTATRPKARTSKPAEDGKRSDNGPLIARPNIDMGPTMTDEERKRMRGALDDVNKDGPKVDPKMLEGRIQVVDGKTGLDPKVITEVFSKNRKAFQGCVDNELRRNPAFGGGKINVSFTIGTSGVVTRAAIDKREIDQSDLGACLKEKAKRMVFPAFEGEPIDVESPLVLAKGG